MSIRRTVRRLASVLAGGLVVWGMVVAVIGMANRWRMDRRARGAVSTRAPRTFYVSPDGNDGADGLTPTRAWRTLARANATDFAPGDSLLLAGGAQFVGTLALDDDDVGTSARPITITSYGRGRATLNAGLGSGIAVRNTGGIRITDLTIVGASHAGMDSAALAREPWLDARKTHEHVPNGIAFRNDLTGGVAIRSIRVARVDVSGFLGTGLLVAGANGRSGFADVVVDTVDAHDNGITGVAITAPYPVVRATLASLWPIRYAHQRVLLDHVRAYRNTGLPGLARDHTGSGIVLSDTRDGAIRDSEAYENGGLCESLAGGPVGIWAFNAQRIVIERNKSIRNRVAGKKDGGGFDLDGGTRNSILQHNYSAENDGAGYLLFEFQLAPPHHGNVVRNNVSMNDGQRNSYAGIQILGDVRDIVIEGNHVEKTRWRDGTARAVAIEANESAMRWENKTGRQIRLANNTFVLGPTVTALDVVPGYTDLVFVANDYRPDSLVRINFEGRSYASLAAWRAASNQERAVQAPAADARAPRTGTRAR